MDQTHQVVAGVIGDMHGNGVDMMRSLDALLPFGVKHVVQVGDFGFAMPKIPVSYITDISDFCVEHGITFYWVDGNHENHDLLGPIIGSHDRDLSEIVPGVFHIRRGGRFTIDGHRFGGLGGAVSADRNRRPLGVSVFLDEAPHRGDLARLGHEPLDILIAHEAITGALPQRTFWPPADCVDDLHAVNDLLQQAVRNTRPKLFVTGHWHQRRTNFFEGTRVETMSANTLPGAVGVILTDGPGYGIHTVA